MTPAQHRQALEGLTELLKFAQDQGLRMCYERDIARERIRTLEAALERATTELTPIVNCLHGSAGNGHFCVEGLADVLAGLRAALAAPVDGSAGEEIA